MNFRKFWSEEKNWGREFPEWSKMNIIVHTQRVNGERINGNNFGSAFQNGLGDA